MCELNSRIRAAILFGTLSGMIIFVGCAKPTGSITGKVTYKGEPLKGGMVTYYSQEDESQVVGTTIGEDGSFTVEKIPTGSYKVTVRTSSSLPKGASGGGGPGGYSGSGGKKNAKDTKDATDAKAKPLPPEKVSEKFQASNPDIMKEVKSHMVEIPGKYTSKESTDITFTVNTGAQTHPIDLK